MAEIFPLLEGLPELDSTATDIESLIFLYSLVQFLRPSVIVEAGTYQGHFAVACARMLPDALVYTADPQRHEMPEVPNLRRYTGDFAEMLAFNPQLKGMVSFAFIDSGDFVEHGMRQRHWNVAKDYLRVGGVMACHDTLTANQWQGQDIVNESLQLTGGRGVCLWRKT